MFEGSLWIHLQGPADQEQPLCLTMKMKVWKGYYIGLDREVSRDHN